MKRLDNLDNKVAIVTGASKGIGAGGHFAAWEQPALHAKEIRDCFAKVRWAWPRQARIRGAVTVKRKEESHD